MSYFKNLAFSLTVILRIYSRDSTFADIYIPTSGFIPLVQSLTEVQAALPFARDYDYEGAHTNGVFRTYWNETVTAKVISEFKQNYTSRGLTARVFASIGDRSARYPFQVNKDEGRDKWVSNAVESLTSIVEAYNLDGIDVYYEHISASEEDFVYAIGELITKLKKDKIITVASIAPSAALNRNFYAPLFKKYGKYIDTVAYQLHNEVVPVPDPQTLASRFNTEATKIYGADKLLAGYSAIYKDWGTVLPIVYFLGGIDILGLNNIFPGIYKARGTSIWFVPPELPELTCASNSSSLPKWMLEASAREIMAIA